jgi:putative transposase
VKQKEHCLFYTSGCLTNPDHFSAESFFHTMKVEAIHGEHAATREEMRHTVFEYIEVDYNRNRRHSANGRISPMAFEPLKAA